MEGLLRKFHQDLDKIFSQGPLQALDQDLDTRTSMKTSQDRQRTTFINPPRVLITPEPQRVHPARACTQALPTGYLQNLHGRIMKDLSEDFALISIRSPHKDPYKI
jgi:hypothetical protein